MWKWPIPHILPESEVLYDCFCSVVALQIALEPLHTFHENRNLYQKICTLHWKDHLIPSGLEKSLLGGDHFFSFWTTLLSISRVACKPTVCQATLNGVTWISGKNWTIEDCWSSANFYWDFTLPWLLLSPVGRPRRSPSPDYACGHSKVLVYCFVASEKRTMLF